MIARIRGAISTIEKNRLVIETQGLWYEILISTATAQQLSLRETGDVTLETFQYFSIDGNRGIPVLVGFLDIMEKEFFLECISISGIGPRAALKAFSKPIPAIAGAIEEGDEAFLQSLEGIGKQKAKQIIATLQGKVGRFALLPQHEEALESTPMPAEIIREAKQVLKRLQYNAQEIEHMIKKAVAVKPDINSIESLLNEIYRQRR